MRLFLVLVLLGAVAGSPLSQRALELERSDEQGSSVLEEEPVGSMPCQGEERGFEVRGAKPPRYELENKPQTFEEAKKTCTKRGGCLASIHTEEINRKLFQMSKRGQVWVGGISSSSGGRPSRRWVDGSSWNYDNWASGNPSRRGTTCVALCSAGGHWRSISCETRLPFICEIPSRFP
ncbi:bone marrow proteoglycan [Pelodiscus sinensis]|uniref:bone marrow proteoglycan n=1 Tax=Pelodiscus sinensis TaxID=13735 RepID=UPI003F6CF410